MIIGKKEIEVVQGDTYHKNVKIKNIEHGLIENIYFTSSKLQINKTLIYDPDKDKYVVVLNPEETNNFAPGLYDYDLTIKFTDNDIKTISYKSLIKVLPKTNNVW